MPKGQGRKPQSLRQKDRFKFKQPAFVMVLSVFSAAIRMVSGVFVLFG